MSVDASTSAGSALLEARAIHLWRGDHHLLKGVSFDVSAGELLQVVGRNGVGKTSLLRVICGLLPAESGALLWQGQSLEGKRDDFCSNLAYLGHTNALKADLTPLENLSFSVHASPTTRSGFESVLEGLGMTGCTHLPTRVLSAGQRRRVALARILSSRRKLWVLDEPITNLDKAGVITVEQHMAEHLRSGGSIVVAAHQQLLADNRQVRVLDLN